MTDVWAELKDLQCPDEAELLSTIYKFIPHTSTCTLWPTKMHLTFEIKSSCEIITAFITKVVWGMSDYIIMYTPTYPLVIYSQQYVSDIWLLHPFVQLSVYESIIQQCVNSHISHTHPLVYYAYNTELRSR